MIFKRGHTWWMRFQFKGERIQRTTRTKNAVVARQVEAALRASLAKGEVGIRDGMTAPTLEQFGPKFFGYLAAHVQPNTLESYRDNWQRLLKFKPLAKARLHLVDKALVEDFVQDQLKEVQPGTVNHCLRVLRRALRLAEDWNLIMKTPRLKMLPGERQREFVLNDRVCADIMKVAPKRLQTLLPFLLDTGLRISEACNLTWDRVSFYPLGNATRGYIYIDKGKSKNARRYIPLTARAKEILEKQKTISRSEFVFVGQDRVRPMSRFTVSEQFRDAKKKLGLPWDAVLHSTRHTMLTNLGASGADAFSIKTLAGHSSVVISQRYVHPTPESLERAMEKLELTQKPQPVQPIIPDKLPVKSETPGINRGSVHRKSQDNGNETVATETVTEHKLYVVQ